MCRLCRVLVSTVNKSFYFWKTISWEMSRVVFLIWSTVFFHLERYKNRFITFKYIQSKTKKRQFFVWNFQVPGLYQPEELESVVTPLRNLAAQEDFLGSPLTFFSQSMPYFSLFILLYLYNFVFTVKILPHLSSGVLQNLHIVLVLDFTRSTFTTLCESNPALYKQCSVMWWPDWSNASMRSIPRMLLEK